MDRSGTEKLLVEKDIVIITSAGRTATAFFGNRLSSIIEDSFSVHEPDLYKFSLKELSPKLKSFGAKHLLWDRFVKDYGVRQLSERNLANDEVDIQTVESVKALRRDYYSNIDQSLIIESYPVWYGLIGELHEAFQNIKVISIVRDPREWIRSNVNRNSYYGNTDWSTKLGRQQLEPSLINDEEYIDKWDHMSWLEKLAWRWMTIYTEISRQAKLGNTFVFRYEDIFLSSSFSELRKLLDTVTIWPDKKYSYDIPDGFLAKKENINFSYDFPEWEKWGESDKQKVLDICGDLMTSFGYTL